MNRERINHYANFEGRWSGFPLDGFRRTCEVPRNIDLKEVGKFLLEKYKLDGFTITDYHTYQQKVFVSEDGEELKGEKRDTSQTYYLHKGYPVKLSTLERLKRNKGRIH